MKIKRYRLLLYITIALTIIGLYEVYSASRVWALYKENDGFYYLKRQSIFMILGYLSLYFFSRINLDRIFKYHKYILIISYILLILVLVPSLSIERNGSRSWFGTSSLAFQPSEFSKLALIISTSVFLSNNYKDTNKFFKTILIVLFFALLNFFLIMLEPDFGTGIVILLTILILTFASRSKIKSYAILSFVGVICLIALIISKPYRLERIQGFINPFSDPLGSGFQIIQSLYAISPSGILGKGIDKSIQKHFFLPEPQTDFIFSIFCEEFGLIGALILLSLFLIFINLGLKISKKSNDLRKSYLALGICSVISIQIIINLAVVVGLIPVTGITLPFISYGGSSLIVNLSFVGLLINIGKENENEDTFSWRW